MTAARERMGRVREVRERVSKDEERGDRSYGRGGTSNVTSL